MAVASAGPYANNLHLAPDRQPHHTSSFNFYRPDALPDAQPKCQSTEGNCYCNSTSFKIPTLCCTIWWLDSQVVSMLDSGAEGPGFKSQPPRCQVTVLGNLHTHRASVYQAAKLVASLLRVARMIAGLAESNGSLLPGLWLASPAGWLPRTGISSGTLHSAVEYGNTWSLLVLVVAVDFYKRVE